MKTVILLATLLLGSAVAAPPADKGGGNGQLVVIPRGHNKPIPYEVAVTWETGKYRNFNRLPCMPGVVEPRIEFNKRYACHALPWLEIVKDLSPELYKDLLDVAGRTHFNIIDNYILWEHKPYPDGELAYKKYEKAAFFNGEIIFSTIAMDRVGPLDSVLTSEQNQGYIVLHELINALYPDAEVKWKLDLGEVFLQKVIFKQSKAEALVNLGLIDLAYVINEKDLDLLSEVLVEIKHVKPDNHYYIGQYLFVIENYLSTGLSFKDAYIAYLEKQKVKGFEEFREAHNEIIRATMNYPGLSKDTEIFDGKFVMDLVTKFKLPLERMPELLKIEYGVVDPLCDVVNKDIIFSGFNKYIQKLDSLNSLDFMKEAMAFMTTPGTALAGILDDNFSSSGLNLCKTYSRWDSWDRALFVNANSEKLKEIVQVGLSVAFDKRGFDYERTIEYINWRYNARPYDDASTIILPPPFNAGDKLLMKGAIYTVSSIKHKKGAYTITFSSPKKARTNYINDLKEIIILKK